MTRDQNYLQNAHNEWAKQHLTRQIKEEHNDLLDKYPEIAGNEGELDYDKALPSITLDGKSRLHSQTPETDDNKLTVAIVGAGVAGVFTAMILDYLKSEIPNFNVYYNILEASDRLGGRLYTHRFSDDKLDYFDVGAMRFPQNKVMKRVFKLFAYLGMNQERNPTNGTSEGTLVPYYMKDANAEPIEPWCFNNKTKWGQLQIFSQQADNKDPFCLDVERKIPPNIMEQGPSSLIDQSVKDVADVLKKVHNKTLQPAKGWASLMAYDKMSTREYLRERGINNETIEWMETFNGGTNWYDQAHSETVLEELNFSYEPGIEWWCILGGSEHLTTKMVEKLTRKEIKYNTRVTKIVSKEEGKVELTENSNNQLTPSTYDGAFLSVPLGCLQHIDTSKAGLNHGIRQAIRSLGYGASAKVGMKFSRAWWIHDLQNKDDFEQEHQIKGGLGHSDLLIRTCVYSSYNHNVEDGTPAVLLCSYTWQQDAQRIASLFEDNQAQIQKLRNDLIENEKKLPNAADDLKSSIETKIASLKDSLANRETTLKEQIFRDLARLHAGAGKTEEQLYTLIKGSYMDHYAFDWYRDPNAMGAFAFFRPGQFSNLWPKIIEPSGQLIMVGEAASPHHAWVVGALESAVHGVYCWLAKNCDRVIGAERALNILCNKDGSRDSPFVDLPAFLDSNMANWIVTNAKIAEANRELWNDNGN